MAFIQLQNLSYSYGDKQVLSNISFEINQGEFFGIIGPNGSGKTTLLSLISGLFSKFNGECLYKGEKIKKYSKKELAKNFAFLEQERTPFLSFTVWEVVSMGRYPFLNKFSKLKNSDLDLIEKVLITLDIWKLQNQPIYKLSGGERQLVSLARAMVQEPKVLFLDEPTNYLDIGHQQLVMQHIKKWQLDKELTILMVSHDLNLAAQYCNRLLLLNNGEIESIGFVNEVIRENIIEKVYKTKPILIEHPIEGIPQIILSNT